MRIAEGGIAKAGFSLTHIARQEGHGNGDFGPVGTPQQAAQIRELLGAARGVAYRPGRNDEVMKEHAALYIVRATDNSS